MVVNRLKEILQNSLNLTKKRTARFICHNSRDKWENLQVVHGDSQEERKYQRKKDYHDKVFQLPQQCKPSEDPSFPQKLLHEYHLHS